MRFASVLAIFMLAVCGALAPTAHGEDDFAHRPPLTWDEIETPLRSFCDVDEGAEWTAAWPKIEDAYLQFLAEEDARRTVDAKPLAELYEPIKLGFATDSAVREYARRWRAHVTRCAAAEDALLDAIVQLVPERDRDAALSLPRGRKISRLMERGLSNPPGMATVARLVLRADLSVDARDQARAAIRTAEDAMLAQFVVLARASDEYRDATARQQAELSRRGAENQALDASAIEAFQLATARELAKPIEAGARAHAAIEPIGVDAIVGLLAGWSREDRRNAMTAISDGSYIQSIAGVSRGYDRRVARAVRRYPADERQLAAIAEAREVWIDAMVERAVQQLQDKKAEALLKEQHMKDSFAGRPSRQLDVINANHAARRRDFVKFTLAWTKVVREALAIPADDPWPKRRPGEETQPEPPEDPDDQFDRELAEGFHSLTSVTWAHAVWCRPLPGVPSIRALAQRLRLDETTATRWTELCADVSLASAEAMREPEDRVAAAVDDDTVDIDAAIAAWSALWTLSTSNIRELTDALRTSLPAVDQHNPSFAVWAATQRTMKPELALRRAIHAVAPSVTSSIPWMDRAGNPLEALDALDLAPTERAALDSEIHAAASKFADAAEALDEVELRTSLLAVIEERKARASWNSDEPVDVRVRAWLANKDWAVGLLDATAPAAHARAAAAKVLRDAITTNLNPDHQRQFERAARNCAYPGIDDERPRFERPILAALTLVAPEPDRAAAVTLEFTRWNEAWDAQGARMTAFDNGGAYRALLRKRQHTAQERHGSAVVRWLEVRRREESLIALRRVARLLAPEQRSQVRGLSPTA